MVNWRADTAIAGLVLSLYCFYTAKKLNVKNEPLRLTKSCSEETMQQKLRAHLLAEACKKEIERRNKKNSLVERSAENTKLNVQPIALNPSELLNATAMRSFISSTIGDKFEKSDETFECGGVSRPVFYYRKNNNSNSITYIALANDREKNDQDIRYIQSGEQSLKIVLDNVKANYDIQKSEHPIGRILIPLQQIDRRHWTLLDVDFSNGTTHYDSKNTVVSCIANFWHGKGISLVKNTLKKAFPGSKYESKNTGEQSLQDNHNCGRYTLLKLLRLLELRQDVASIKDINQIFSPKCEETTRECDDSEEDIISIS